MKVKICGVNDPAAIDAAAEAGADWIGFVFFPPSPRYLTAAAAAGLSARAAGGPQRVGLFVEPEDDAIAAVLDALALDVLQLYAAPARCGDIAARFGVPVWRSVAISDPGDLPCEDDAEAWVIEPRPPAGASHPGGNAQSLDWAMLRGWHPAKPWLLAGGLTPGNVAQAIAASGAEAVDVSSGVESEPGVKSPSLIRAFIHAARIDHAGALG